MPTKPTPQLTAELRARIKAARDLDARSRLIHQPRLEHEPMAEQELRRCPAILGYWSQRAGQPCGTITPHASGYCGKHRGKAEHRR